MTRRSKKYISSVLRAAKMNEVLKMKKMNKLGQNNAAVEGTNQIEKKENTEEPGTSELTASELQPLPRATRPPLPPAAAATRQSGVATPASRTYVPRCSPSDLQSIMAELATTSILKISDEKTLQLLDLYKNEDCLWNTNSENYKNKERRSLAAQKIAAILDLPNFTAKHVLLKFRNLRNSYSQELRKISHSLTWGDQHKYEPKVFWFSKMDSFMRPHLHARPSEPSIPEWTQLEDDDDQLLVPVTSKPAPAPSPAAGASNGESSETKRRKLPARRAKDRPENWETTIAQTLKDVQSQLHDLSSEDYHDTFGKYVASLLRALPPQRALALQPQIVSLITREADEDPLSADPECQNSDQVEIKLEITE